MVAPVTDAKEAKRGGFRPVLGILVIWRMVHAQRRELGDVALAQDKWKQAGVALRHGYSPQVSGALSRGWLAQWLLPHWHSVYRGELCCVSEET